MGVRAILYVRKRIGIRPESLPHGTEVDRRKEDRHPKKYLILYHGPLTCAHYGWRFIVIQGMYLLLSRFSHRYLIDQVGLVSGTEAVVNVHHRHT